MGQLARPTSIVARKSGDALSSSGDGEGGDKPGCCCGAGWRHWQGWGTSLEPPLRLEPLPQASHQVDPPTFHRTASYFWSAILLRRSWTDVQLKITPLVAAWDHQQSVQFGLPSYFLADYSSYCAINLVSLGLTEPNVHNEGVHHVILLVKVVSNLLLTQ